MADTIIAGRTADGRHVLVCKDDDGVLHIEVDGKPCEQILRALLLRDGGTRVWHTTAGRISKRHRLDGDRRAFIDGDEILASSNPEGAGSSSLVDL